MKYFSYFIGKKFHVFGRPELSHLYIHPIFINILESEKMDKIWQDFCFILNREHLTIFLDPSQYLPFRAHNTQVVISRCLQPECFPSWSTCKKGDVLVFMAAPFFDNLTGGKNVKANIDIDNTTYNNRCLVASWQ